MTREWRCFVTGRIHDIVVNGVSGLGLVVAVAAGPASAEGPSYDCSAVESGSIEELTCSDGGLSALDRTLAEQQP